MTGASSGDAAELGRLLARWRDGWVLSRTLPAPVAVPGGWRVDCGLASRDVEFQAAGGRLDPPAIGEIAHEVRRRGSRTWLSVATRHPAQTAVALRRLGLRLVLVGESLMTIPLALHPHAAALPDGYRLEVTDGPLVRAEITAPDGTTAATGQLAVVGTDAVPDRIRTADAHQRRGLGRAVMGALVGVAAEAGATHGILIASIEGRALYERLGWARSAAVVVARG